MSRRGRDISFVRKEALENVRETGNVMSSQNDRAGDSVRPLEGGEEMSPTSIRVPLALKSRTKAYATLRHMTLAQILVRSTELLLECDGGRSVGTLKH